jgi:hypothetical protein
MMIRASISAQTSGTVVAMGVRRRMRRLTDKDEFIIGGGFANIKYDDGQSHAPMFFMGWRF